MAYPKIGIRPIIDGRWGGVREGLEEQTRNMAQAAKELIEQNVFYSDGTPAQCVISPCTIGGGAEAAKAAEFFSTQNVCATLSVTPCWCYGSETMDMDPLTIKAVWGFNGTERPGAVYLAAAMSAHAQRGLPAFAIYGHDVQDVGDKTVPCDVQEKLLRFARCAIAVGQMRNKAYVNFGSVAMGIMGSYCDASFFQKYFGIRAEWVDLTEVLRRITLEIYDHEEYERALAWTKANCKEGFDKNAGVQWTEITTKSKVVPPDKDWEFIVKMALVCRDIMLGSEKIDQMGWHEEALGRNAIAGGFQGQRMWTDWLPNGDFMEAMLNSTFDWRGKREPLILATENDNLNGISMLLLKLLTGQAAVFSGKILLHFPQHIGKGLSFPCGKEQVMGTQRPDRTPVRRLLFLFLGSAVCFQAFRFRFFCFRYFLFLFFWPFFLCPRADFLRLRKFFHFRNRAFFLPVHVFRCSLSFPNTRLRVRRECGFAPFFP